MGLLDGVFYREREKVKLISLLVPRNHPPCNTWPCRRQAVRSLLSARRACPRRTPRGSGMRREGAVTTQRRALVRCEGYRPTARRGAAAKRSPDILYRSPHPATPAGRVAPHAAPFISTATHPITSPPSRISTAAGSLLCLALPSSPPVRETLST